MNEDTPIWHGLIIHLPEVTGEKEDSVWFPVMYESPIPRISNGAAEVKRFFERWSADPSFRELTRSDPEAAAVACGISINPDTFRQRWDRKLPEDQHRPLPAAVEEFFEHIEAKIAYRDRAVAEGGSDNPRLAAWRRRQIARGMFELGEARTAQIIHSPFALELNVGCSVGCWFCGVSAPKLTDIFAYTPENRQLWREVLSVLRGEVGAASQWAFCYWATDPLDNPDYERFLIDFHEIIGVFPQTTTALGLRDPLRTRRLLQLSEERGCFANRFSILALRKFKEVHTEFSAHELRSVECIPQFKGTVMNFANSGRARERYRRTAERKGEDFADRAGSIACISGFLLNLVEGSVKLISPCRASDRWPLGYIVFDEARFGSACDLRREVQRMIAANMPGSVDELPRIAFAEGLVYAQTKDGFELSSDLRKSVHEHPSMTGALQELGRLIQQGKSNAETISFVLSYHGLPPASTIGMLQTMFERGLLREGPGLAEMG